MNSSVREAKRVVLCDDHEIVREAIKAIMVLPTATAVPLSV